MGLLNALGGSAEEIAPKLLSGAQDRLVPSSDWIPGRTVHVGAVTSPLSAIPAVLDRLSSRCTALIISAFMQIAPAVAAEVERFGRDRIAVVLGSSTSGINEGESAVRYETAHGRMPENYSYPRQEMGSVAEALARYAGFGGPAYTVSTACSSSAKVFRSGQLLIESGICDAAIVGGADILCRLTLNGFGALELLSNSITNPFSRNRSGINIGEGAALFLMTRERGGIQLLGTGESSDAYHISAPDPEARGAIAALEEALDRGGLAPRDVSYVNLHGTGTLHNDAMEARAVSEVFSDVTPCSSTKPLVGHMLGASGATEAAFCWMVLERYARSGSGRLELPPHRFDGLYDPALPRIRLAEQGESATAHGRAVCVSNSFGFGGSNCAIALGTEPA